MKNYYKILEVSSTATQEEIKKSFRCLAKKYHPDRNKDNEEALRKFQDISEAYEVIGKEDSRKKYDEKLNSNARKNNFTKREEAKKEQKGASKEKGTSANAKKASIENLNSYFESFFGFSANSNDINQDKLKKNKNPIDVSNMFDSYFNMKKK